MQPTALYTIKTITFPSTWVATILALVLTWLLLRMQFGKKTATLYGDMAFTFIIVWKFSVIITDFKTVIVHPLTALYFNGGKIGIFLALIVVIIQALYTIIKQKLHKQAHFYKALAWAIISTQSVYQLAMVLLNDNTMWQEVITLVAFLVMLLLLVSKKIAPFAQLVLFLGVHMSVTALQPQGFLQQSSWAITVLLVLSYAVIYYVEKRKAI